MVFLWEGRRIIKRINYGMENNIWHTTYLIQLSYDKGQRFFEDEIIEDATLDDIDELLVNDFKEHFDISERSTEEILKARRFLINGKLTKAAILTSSFPV